MSVTETKSKYPQWKTDSINEISELVNKWSFNNESRISKRSNQHSI